MASILSRGATPHIERQPNLQQTQSRGAWYERQLVGSANLTGSSLFHIMTGNLSHQIEHHLFPDLPAHRYPEIAPKVQAVCEKYGLPYNTGGLAAQFGSVVAKIVRLALPGRSSAAAETADDAVDDDQPVDDAAPTRAA